MFVRIICIACWELVLIVTCFFFYYMLFFDFKASDLH